MEQRGLVWLYRLIREPRRLWRRYLVNDLVGLALCLADLVALRLRLRARIA
jgi:N-acetylglucosaminyldiphosphoundecaprenol N-acetyl-beta-D-mannosaminyltransferase